MAAGIADVFSELKELSAHLWRGYDADPSPRQDLRPGMVPDILNQLRGLAKTVTDASVAISRTHALVDTRTKELAILAGPAGAHERAEAAIHESRELLTAMNEQTLGRMEGELKAVFEFLTTVRADLTDISAKLDGLKSQVESLP